MNALDGTTALVTGASGGLGRAICAALTAAGARVAATGRMSTPPAELKADIWLQHDVTSQEDWQRVMETVQQRFGHLDCLINNAGICLIESIADMTLQQWRQVWSVNVDSIVMSLQASLPLLRKSGKRRIGGAAIVNVSSVAGLHGVAHASAYCASKGAVTLLTKAAAKEFAELGYQIRINSIHPGAVETPMLDFILMRHVEAGLSTSVQAHRESWRKQIPMGRMARAEDIAGGVVFLCSADARFMTGAELVIDGGATA